MTDHLTGDVPLGWRRLLAEILGDAEQRGLGHLTVSFTAAAGCEDQAAEFVAERAGFLADRRWVAPREAR